MSNINVNFDELAKKGGLIAELLTKSNLAWTVSKEPLNYADGSVSNKVGLRRSDNRDELGVHSPTYEVFQNHELAELVYELANTFDFAIERGLELNGGKKVSIQLSTGSIKRIGENADTVKKYITAINSFDGSTGVAFGFTYVVISCSNTFFHAYKGLDHRIRHSSTLRDKIEVALKGMEQMQEEEKSLYELYFKMADTPITKEIVANTIKIATGGVNIDAKMSELEKDFSKAKIRMSTLLINDTATEIAQKGDTLWGLFNGVTKFTTHHSSAPSRENGREESKMFGANAQVDKKVFSYLTSLV